MTITIGGAGACKKYQFRTDAKSKVNQKCEISEANLYSVH